MKWVSRALKWGVGSVLLVTALILFSNLVMIFETRDRVVENLQNVQAENVAMLLGTSKYRQGGGSNQYFSHRIAAAVELYKQAKVRHILVSGDNGLKYYNEPADMLESLMKAGIPRSAITLDYAGFRTLDSVVRLKEIFGQNSVVVITQKFHAFRALYLCDHFDIDAQAYVANDPSYSKQKVFLREILARTYAMLDLYVLKTRPKYLGDKEEITFD